MRHWLPALLVSLIGASVGTAHAQELPAPDFWQIPFGTTAETLDAVNLIQPSCGTNGGPPSLPLASFTEYDTCPLDDSGYHEVWYRYDDTLEYIARARRDPVRIGRYLATAFASFPVVLSLLLDDQGAVRGYRVFSDDRVSENARVQAYTIAGNLRGVLGTEWQCQDLPLDKGEEAIENVFVKQDCVLETDRLTAQSRGRYLFKPGQHLVDMSTGRPTTNIFDSTAMMEVLQADPLIDETPLDLDDYAPPVMDVADTDEGRFLSGEIADCPGCELPGADLRRRDLTGADLSGANLERAVLHRATLRQADFSNANLAGAIMNVADISRTSFTGADLTGAQLFDARGAGPDFTNAKLDNARMGEIQLRQPIFTGASIVQTDLGGADLNRADFTSATVNGSYLFEARLLEADFSDVKMHSANLDGALLREANLTGADLSNSDLQHADLRGADLSDANFTGVRLSFANLRETIQRGTDFTDARMPR